MLQRYFVFLTLIMANSALAEPRITSISPSSGPVTGGTTVIIRGSGFNATCPPAQQFCRTAVVFGRVGAASFRIIDQQTIEAVTPPFFPGQVFVGVSFPGGAAFVPDAFTYVGEINDAFERILLPIFSPPADGSFYSKFSTSFFLWSIAGADIPAFGLSPAPCDFIPACSPQPGPSLTVFQARIGAPNNLFEMLGDPGYFFFIPKGAYARIAASLRVSDISRQNQSFGTRIPVVPERDFRADFLALIDVPMTPLFRDTLRIYSLDPQTSVSVRVIRYDSTKIYAELNLDLRDPSDMLHPGYAQISNFGNIPPDNVRIEIEPLSGKRIWAFVSVTNNDTQQSTVVAPR